MTASSGREAGERRPRGWNFRRLAVTLECPKCGRTKVAAIHHSDPPGTAKVRAVCDRCPDDAALVDYFDSAGRQIDRDGTPMRNPDHA